MSRPRSQTIKVVENKVMENKKRWKSTWMLSHAKRMWLHSSLPLAHDSVHQRGYRYVTHTKVDLFDLGWQARKRNLFDLHPDSYANPNRTIKI